jgi:type VI secretion system FHA domain protein
VAPGGMGIPDDYDPLADFLPPRLAAAPAHVELAAVPAAPFIPPVPAPAFQPAPVIAAAVQVAAVSSAAASDGAVLQALLRGLGMSALETKLSAPELAELVGAMLREATTGTMGVLTARAVTKRESRLEMTMIGSIANNPLKFFPDAEHALTQMLTSAHPGYMAPVKAYANAYDDLKAHELAMLAGMNGALSGMLQRFDPDVIEQRLQVPGVIDKLLVANRKAKLWDRLVVLYKELSNEAGDDFQRLFGEKFGVAYEEQMHRLRQGRK